ncbi:FAD/NAD(P)-binding oxidoreductase [Pseudomonas sp. NA13]
MPIPGWTLPGVMTAGAGQILLKSAAMVPATPVVLAGCGPLLYLLAVQYLRAGIAIEALVDTSHRSDLLQAWRQVPSALRGWRDLLKGLGLLMELKRAGVRHFRGACNLQVDGTDRACALSFDSQGRSQRVRADLILLHQGVVPNTQVSWSLRLEHDWSEQQLCWITRRNQWGESSVPGILSPVTVAPSAGPRSRSWKGAWPRWPSPAVRRTRVPCSGCYAAPAPHGRCSTPCIAPGFRIASPPMTSRCAAAKRSALATFAATSTWVAWAPTRPRPSAVAAWARARDANAV